MSKKLNMNENIHFFIYGLYECFINSHIITWRSKESDTIYIGISKKERLNQFNQNFFSNENQIGFFFHLFEDSIEESKILKPDLLIKIKSKKNEISLNYINPDIFTKNEIEFTDTFSTTISDSFINANTLKHHLNITNSPNENKKKHEWEQIFNRAMNYLNKKELDKIVLSLKFNYQLAIPVNNSIIFWKPIFQSLFNLDQYFIFYRDNFGKFEISQSPETLINIKQSTYSIDSLAGTRKTTRNKAENDKIQQEFLSNKKELKEQKIVQDAIEAILNENQIQIDKITPVTIKELRNVQHLYSQLTGKINENKKLDLLKLLHPTPAVGTLPYNGKKLISLTEKSKRGIYAGIIGFKNEDKIDTAVNIRNISMKEKEMTVYGGCGILKESLIDNEYKEIKRKLLNYTEYIKLPNQDIQSPLQNHVIIKEQENAHW